MSFPYLIYEYESEVRYNGDNIQTTSQLFLSLSYIPPSSFMIWSNMFSAMAFVSFLGFSSSSSGLSAPILSSNKI